MITVLIVSLVSLILVAIILIGVDFVAHFSRYRYYISQYPQNNRGKVWKHTK